LVSVSLEIEMAEKQEYLTFNNISVASYQESQVSNEGHKF